MVAKRARSLAVWLATASLATSLASAAANCGSPAVAATDTRALDASTLAASRAWSWAIVRVVRRSRRTRTRTSLESIVDAPSAASWAAVRVCTALSPAAALLALSSWKVTWATATYLAFWERAIPAPMPAQRTVTATTSQPLLRRTRR